MPISVESTWATKFWENRNCAWYLERSKVNTILAWGHFQQDGKVDANLDFWCKIADECLVNSIGVYKENEDLGSRPLRTCRITKKVHVGSQRLQNIAGCEFPSKKKEQSQTKISKTKVYKLSRLQKKGAQFLYMQQ